MLNFRSDELRQAKTTESTAPAVTQQQRQLHFGVRPRSSTSRDDDEIQSANSSKRMPDLQPRTTRARGMSGGCVDALRRAIALEHERAEAAAAAVKNKQPQQQQQRPRAYTTTTTSSFSRFDQIEMETKRMMGWSSRGGGASVSGKDRDLGGYEKRGRVGGRDHSDPNSDDDEEEEEEDGVMQELQMRPRTDSLGFIPVDDHRTLAAGATSYEHEYDPEFDLIDEDEGDGDGDGDPGCYLVDTPELAAFLGVTIPLHQQQQQQQYPQQQRQAYPPPMFPKAASFSGQHYSQYYQSQNQSQPQSLRGMVPCSPPVPIPPKQMLRRRNSVTGSLLTTHPSSSSSRKYGSGRGDVLCDESNYSRTQCEARFWDEDWNFKLSLEARESFEASNKNTNSSSRSNSASGRAVWKPQSTSSMASTADTFRDDDDDVIGSFGGMGVGGENNDSGDEDEADQVFDMDDL